MSKGKCDIRIGTSGWYYNHWSGLFYPDDLPKTKWFGHYAKTFDTVEANSTFYHLPKPQSIKKWYKQSPKNFLYAVKANRFITHIKRLKTAEEPLKRFFEIITLLKEKLGPVLYQLPPGLHKNPALLEDFLALLPPEPPAVFEFRHESWYSDDIYELLKKAGVGFCIHDMPGLESPAIITADVIYIRFHGTTGRYSGNYSDAALQNWANWIRQHSKKSAGIYAYFNNDFNAYAVYNAKTLKELLCTL